MTAQELEKLLADVTPGDWRYRPEKHDDWGFVRGPDTVDGFPSFICQAKDARVSEEEMSLARVHGIDPWEANARLIAMAPALARRVIAAEKLAEALRNAQKQLEEVHDNAFTQAAGRSIVTDDGRPFSCYQLNRCSEVSAASKKALAAWEAAQ